MERLTGQRTGLSSSVFNRLLAVVLAGVFVALCSPEPIWASHTGFAPCPLDLTPPADPSGRVVVSILSVDPNTDLEDDDDFVPFYDNQADIFGSVTIDGTEFELPKMEDDDSPHWDGNGRFVQAVVDKVISISITIKEDDELLTGDDDIVDINSLVGQRSVEFKFNLESLEIESDVLGLRGGQGVFETSASGDEGARIRFKVETEDGRPVTTADFALVEADIIQVVPQVPRLVAGKPAILRVRAANNYSTPVSTSLRIAFAGFPGFDRTFPIAVGAREVRTFYFFRDAPLIFPPRPESYRLSVNVSVVDPGTSTRQPQDPRNRNDGINQLSWKVVSTRDPVLFWAKVGTLLDITELPSDEALATIRDLGTAFIKATYPIADLTNSSSPIPIIPPKAAAIDWLATIAAGLGVPADSLLPFAFLAELNAYAGLLPTVDTLMGALPNNWFDRFVFDLWAGVNGLSLTEFSPHAVIFLSSHNGEPAMTLPGHELGHTLGLSTDPRLKSWVCDADVALLKSLLCGAFGGFDEYKHEALAFKDGNPAKGFWVRRGDEPFSLSAPGMVDAPQCDSHCLMGNSPDNSHADWATKRRWIDAGDFAHLTDKLQLSPDPDLIFLSGMISRDDRIFLGPWYHFGQGVPDREDSRGLYVFRFLDRDGETIQEVGLPLNRSATDVQAQDLPITFFGLRLAFPEQTKRIEIWNRRTQTLLAAREVSAGIPQVRILFPRGGRVVRRGTPLLVVWQGRDADRDRLTYAVQVSPDGEQWWPVAQDISAPFHVLPTGDLSPGHYFVRVLAHDGIHVGESESVRFTVQEDGRTLPGLERRLSGR